MRIRLGTHLYQTHKVPDTIYQNAIHVLGQDAVVDLASVLGYYAFISMTINMFKVDTEGEDQLS